jgi:hypothetical protein
MPDRSDATVANVADALVRAMGQNVSAVKCFDMRKSGAVGGELTVELLVCISKLRAKGNEDAVKFDTTTVWTLPTIVGLKPFTKHLKLNLKGLGAVQGSSVCTRNFSRDRTMLSY